MRCPKCKMLLRETLNNTWWCMTHGLVEPMVEEEKKKEKKNVSRHL